VLITGSSGNLGAYLVEAFAREGHAVFGFDIAQPASLPAGARHIECDVSSPSSVERAIAAMEQPFDVVINNAGLIFSAPLLSFKDGKLEVHDFEAWNKVLSVTLSSAFYVSAHAARQMVAAGKRGTIINISSICAEGNAGQSAYSAAKAGVNALTMTLAKELGPMGVRVAAIAPGFIDTPSTHKAVGEEALVRIKKSIPLKKLGSAQQLAHAVRFIIDNEYFHGKVLELDGGLTI
jgi:3-oxoacyl-[acyl-carrier protein] reductase